MLQFLREVDISLENKGNILLLFISIVVFLEKPFKILKQKNI